jgi:phosphoglycolate phosphatase-like HAD superfamily hydrolase
VSPFPGARDLLVRVHQAGQRVVLASSASKSEVDHYLDLLDVRELVSATTSADDVEHTKPAPDIFASALGKVAPLGPGEVLVVGDTPYDVEAAAKCGIGAVAVRSGKFDDAVLPLRGRDRPLRRRGRPARRLRTVASRRADLDESAARAAATLFFRA